MSDLILTGRTLTLEELNDVIYKKRKVVIPPEAYQRLKNGRDAMQKLSDEGKPIYGFNRGVGQNKDVPVDESFFDEQNLQLMYSHSLGMKPYNTKEQVRAIMAIRLNNMLIGASCATDELANIYRDFLNNDICPRIPERGAVGEADITTITHLCLAFTGEGMVEYEGSIMTGKEAMEKAGIKSYRPKLKDVHTIMLSNCQGEGMAAIMIKEAEDLIKISDLIFCLDYEGLNGNIESLSREVNELRGMPGQIECAERCRRYLEGSYLYEPGMERALQDALSFRGGHTVTGAVTDALNYLKGLLTLQINSPADNPCIIPETGQVLVTSNFESITTAVATEMVSIALGSLSRTINHRMIKMTQPEFTGLTRFLAPKDGSSQGYSEIMNNYSYLDAETRNLINPSSMDFYQVHAGIEDRASNLPLICSKGLKIIDNIRYMVGIESLYAAQAVDLREGVKLGKYTQKAYELIREVIPPLDRNRRIFDDIEKSYELVKSGKLIM